MSAPRARHPHGLCKCGAIVTWCPPSCDGQHRTKVLVEHPDCQRIGWLPPPIVREAKTLDERAQPVVRSANEHTAI